MTEIKRGGFGKGFFGGNQLTFMIFLILILLLLGED
jgi:hypothetical protein